MLVDAIAIDAPERRRGAVGAADVAQAVHVEQQPPVAGAPHLVELHQPRFDVGPLALRFALRAPSVRRGRVASFCLDVGGLALDLFELLHLDRAIDLELAQLGEQRALLRRERLRFALQRRRAARAARFACASVCLPIRRRLGRGRRRCDTGPLRLDGPIIR